jgi:hypothetical protein
VVEWIGAQVAAIALILLSACAAQGANIMVVLNKIYT